MSENETEWRAALRCDECLDTTSLKGDMTVESVSDARITSYECRHDDCDGNYVVEKNEHRV